MDMLSTMEQWLSENLSYSTLIGIIIGSALGLIVWALVLVREDTIILNNAHHSHVYCLLSCTVFFV